MKRQKDVFIQGDRVTIKDLKHINADLRGKLGRVIGWAHDNMYKVTVEDAKGDWYAFNGFEMEMKGD